MIASVRSFVGWAWTAVVMAQTRAIAWSGRMSLRTQGPKERSDLGVVARLLSSPRMYRAGALVVILAAGCGRLGFDELEPPPLSVELRVVAGVTSFDVEVCTTRSARLRYAVARTPWPADWDVAYLDAQIAAPADLVATSDDVADGSGCRVATYRTTEIEIPLNVYLVADVDETSELAQHERATALAPMFEPFALPATGGHTQRYWRHRPERFYRDVTAPLPVLIALAGQGEEGDDTGTNFDLMKERGLQEPFTDRLASVIDLPFLVIAPQCNNNRTGCFGWPGHEAFIDEVVEHARTEQVIDEQRVYVTGLSTGGEGAFRYAIHAHRRPQGDPGVVVAALVPIASTNVDDAFYAANLCSIAPAPVWAFHNSDDPTQPVTNSRTFVSRVNGCSPTVPAQLAEGTGGHNAWRTAYNDTHGFSNQGFSSIYSWLLAQSR